MSNEADWVDPSDVAELIAQLAGERPRRPPSTSTRSSSSSSSPRRPSSSTPRPRARKVSVKGASRRASFLASLEARGARGCRPRDFPARVQAGVRSAFENRSGAEARRALGRLPRDQRPIVLHAARNPGDGRVLPADLSHPWSRWVVACAWLLWALRRKSGRNGMRSVVDGYTQPMICGLFRNSRGEPYSRSRVFATSYRRGVATCGPMVALREAGLWMWAAPPLEHANPRYVGPPHVAADGTERRFAFAVYWLRDPSG